MSEIIFEFVLLVITASIGIGYWKLLQEKEDLLEKLDIVNMKVENYSNEISRIEDALRGMSEAFKKADEQAWKKHHDWVEQSE